MSITQILAVSESVGIKDQKIVGQVTTRNLHISASEYISAQSFEFNFKPMSYMLYSQSRTILSALRVADKIQEQYLNFGSTGWVNYIAYQGDMSSAQISGCQWQTSSSGKTLVLGSLPATSSFPSTRYIVKTGDFCQVGRYAYIATANVLRGTSSTVSIPVHRTLMTTLVSPLAAVIGQYGTTISMGGSTYTGITFPILLTAYPTYNLVPMQNDSYINWSGDFDAFEVVL
jgi:hypothetical protein